MEADGIYAYSVSQVGKCVWYLVVPLSLRLLVINSMKMQRCVVRVYFYPVRLIVLVEISNLPPSLRYKPEELPKSCKVTIVTHEDKALSRRINSVLSYLDAVKLVCSLLLDFGQYSNELYDF